MSDLHLARHRHFLTARFQAPPGAPHSWPAPAPEAAARPCTIREREGDRERDRQTERERARARARGREGGGREGGRREGGRENRTRRSRARGGLRAVHDIQSKRVQREDTRPSTPSSSHHRSPSLLAFPLRCDDARCAKRCCVDPLIRCKMPTTMPSTNHHLCPHEMPWFVGI